MVLTDPRCQHCKQAADKPPRGTGSFQGGIDEAVFRSVRCRARRGTVRRRCIRSGCPGADHPLGASQQHRSSRQLRRQEIRRNPLGQERRQAQHSRVCRVAARQRAAAAIGAARRHPGDAVGLHHVAGHRGPGIRPAGFPLHRQHHRSGRCAGPWRLRQGDDRHAAAARPDRARLLGSRLSQRHQQQASRSPSWRISAASSCA